MPFHVTLNTGGSPTGEAHAHAVRVDLDQAAEVRVDATQTLNDHRQLDVSPVLV